jgi:hypothetical protein
MKKALFPIMAALLAIGCGNNAGTPTPASDSDTAKEPVADNSTPKPVAAMPDSATMMKNWAAYSAPGEPHKMMASWNGNWDGEISMFHAPGAPPEITKGSTSNKMVMGGRYQISNHTSNMMGMPFEGMATLAYDNAKKVFISSWLDNMGTGMMVLQGPWDEATKSMTLKGKMVDPGMGDGTEMDVKEIFKVIDNDHQTMEMYGNGPDGKEMKMMEIKYTRKK